MSTEDNLPGVETPVELRCQDVRQTMPDDKFHLILCRNLVYTYFDETLLQQTLGRVAQRPLPGGALVVGRHEALAEGTSFRPWHRGQGIYGTASSVLTSGQRNHGVAPRRTLEPRY